MVLGTGLVGLGVVGLVVVVGVVLLMWAWPWRAWLHGHGVFIRFAVFVVFVVFVDMCSLVGLIVPSLSPRLRVSGLVPVRDPRHMIVIQVHVAVAQPMRVQFG